MFSFITKIRKVAVMAFLTALVFLVGCGTDNTGESVGVYETNQYMLYKRVYSLVSQCFDGLERATYVELIESESGIWNFESEDISVKAQYGENYYDTEYTILIDGEEVHSFQMPSTSYLNGARVVYVDITDDRSRDIVVVGEPPRGTFLPSDTYWIYAYDVKNNCSIEIFDEGHSLTEVQKSQLEEFCDEEFYEIFPNISDIYREYTNGEQYVDKQGHLYYNIWLFEDSERLDNQVGDMIVFFDYNSEEKRFDVIDMIYMPTYVYE